MTCCTASRPDRRGTMRAMSSIDEALIEWKTWLEALETQIYVLHHRRQIHDEFMEMLEAADDGDQTFRDAFHGMYIESQVMAIRRTRGLRRPST